jgi:Leucine-rich repeat (LRR) protein
MFPALEELSCSTPSKDGKPVVGRSKLADLSPLKGLPLMKLNCAYASITDLTPLTNMPLQTLNIDGNLLTDLDTLRGLKITSLCARQMASLTNIAGLEKMPLTLLELDATRVTDLTPIADCPIKSLCLRYSSVKDLAPLQNMKLEYLYLPGSRGITSLEPLKNMTLKKLDVCGVSCDLAPLKSVNVNELMCSFHPDKHVALLKRHKSLATINGAPVEDFLQTM